ncbi:hypothetical protein [Anaerosinus massiliensis]|uniref:hypothetical protein n=1 Tax=Massilibacillus massiliensis TaxID=1806837 RepID=UPI000DA62C02|nr:hypothetical protein [Massilibacillus massiliensis]
MDTEYFLLCAETNILNTARPYGLERYKKVCDLGEVNIARVNEPNQYYLDFFEFPRRMVSDKIKKILEESNPNTIFKRVAIIDPSKTQQMIYWLFALKEIDFIADTCKCEKLDFKNIMIDHQKVKKHGYDFFIIMSVFEPFLIVNLEIAEKILRTNPVGIRFERIKAI